MANDETKEPDRDVEAAAVRALDAVTRALDAFTRAADSATNAATRFVEELERDRARARQ
jgi:hypothetical protein